jgi:hypothetical protein
MAKGFTTTRESTTEDVARKTRSQVNSQHGTATIQQTLDDARQALRKNAKAYVAAGISDALNDIANGDFGDIGNEILGSFKEFTEALEMDALTLEAREVTEVPLLSSSTEEG